MIIVKLVGGIGNQMFQYALGRHLSLISNSPLILDKLYYFRNNFRKYELKFFNIKENNNLTFNSILKINKFRIFNFLINRLKFKRFSMIGYIKENNLNFNPNVLKIRGDTYLDGYWMSEKYFLSIKDIIKGDFKIKLEKNDENIAIVNKIISTNSVSIHIRRGDYISNIKTYNFHGICTLDYYYKAIELIKDYVINPTFFVFSDEPDWAKNNLKIKDIVYFIDNNLENSYKDIILMSLCKHNIIVNSSFSWWGAWLNDNPDKIVVSPKKWFENSNIKVKDLIPYKWIKI